MIRGGCVVTAPGGIGRRLIDIRSDLVSNDELEICGVDTVFNTTLAYALVEKLQSSVPQIGCGIWARFGNTVRLALGITTEPLLMPARRRNHRDLTAAIGCLHAELREKRREIQQLRVENEVLREAAEPLIHHAPARERFAFVHRLRGRFGIRQLCRILVTDHSNYHAWVRAKTRRDERAIDDQELLAWIRETHTAHPAYGAERITRELKHQDVDVGRRL